MALCRLDAMAMIEDQRRKMIVTKFNKLGQLLVEFNDQVYMCNHPLACVFISLAISRLDLPYGLIRIIRWIYSMIIYLFAIVYENFP